MAQVKTQKHIKPNPKTIHQQELLISVCMWLCTMLHNTAQNSC